LLHKPREVVTTLSDPEGRPTVAGLLRNIPERVFPVGRLDFHTSGALLFTNDGDMTQALLHPRKLVPKTYIAKVKGEVPLKALQALREGVTLDDGHKTRKSDTFVVNAERGNTWLQLTITEGKNRQIHRMLEAVGFAVMRLSRPSFAGLDVEGLRPGQCRPLMQSEIAKLKRDYLNPSMKAEADRKKKARWAKAEAEADAAQLEQTLHALEENDGADASDADADDKPPTAVPAAPPQRPARPPDQRRPPNTKQRPSPPPDKRSARYPGQRRAPEPDQRRAPAPDKRRAPYPDQRRAPEPDKRERPDLDKRRAPPPDRRRRGPAPDKRRAPEPDPVRGADPKALRLRANKLRTRLRNKQR
jgi:23S rRNA pseudouridine2605 synthase